MTLAHQASNAIGGFLIQAVFRPQHGVGRAHVELSPVLGHAAITKVHHQQHAHQQRAVDEARRMANLEFEYLRVNVRLDDYEHANEVKTTLTERFGHLFLVETWEDQKADFLRAVNNEKVLLVIVLYFLPLLDGGAA